MLHVRSIKYQPRCDSVCGVNKHNYVTGIHMCSNQCQIYSCTARKCFKIFDLLSVFGLYTYILETARRFLKVGRVRKGKRLRQWQGTVKRMWPRSSQHPCGQAGKHGVRCLPKAQLS